MSQTTKVLYVSDLDGTLLNDRSVVSERSAQLLQAAIDRGALFTIATARTPATVDGLMSQI
ncbi:MAG: HAD hydrolase family protein, partial [Bacteroidales bacterium]|nr:HAD hydrolase family protein [Bacteroidales bacterium]